MAHDHSQPHTHDHARDASSRALALTLALTATFTVAEVIAGILTDSLALVADAAHMLSDDLSLGVALFAIWLARRPSSPKRTFGFQRAEILAALFNGVTLVLIAAWIFWEAAQRFGDPPEVTAGPMLVVAIAGLAINVAAAAILHGKGEGSLNVSAAYRHVLADLAGSVGVIVAAAIILTTGWEYADPLVSVLIGLLILASSWSIIRDSLAILLEASPRGLDVEKVGQTMAAMPDVSEVHDLHVWTITSGFPALSAHVLVDEGVDCHDARLELEALLKNDFDLTHTTLQVANCSPELLQIETSAGPMPAQGSAAENPIE